MRSPAPAPSAFDVVVVGAGAAGCVMAARLAETSSRTVALFEAGPDRRADLPDGFRNGWDIDRAELDWGFVSEPDGRGEAVPVRRKKVVGGTSWQTRFTPRGAPADFDDWQARGNPGWGWEHVLPYFVRLETDADYGDRPWHGDSGPLPSRRYLDLPQTEAMAAALDALADAGFPSVEDHNEPGAVGAGPMPMNSVDGVRVTTADVYLPLGSTPPNLTIASESLVAEVVFEGTEASGVRLADGTIVNADAVVLCAGTYGSPTILLRSGVGPAEHLRALGLPVRVDLAGVGANLADHPTVDLDLGYHGPGRSTPLLHTIATFHGAQTPPEAAPDLMLWVADPEGEPAELFFDVVLLKPRSRGSLRLASADPAASPLITLPQLDDAADVERLAEGYRRAVEVAGRPALRRLCDGPGEPPHDDRELHALIRARAYSVPHTVGTCAMGPRPEDGAVVDAEGRVHGLERLTVADASIMPEAPSGFTHVPTIMIAERLSERI
jgi:choline dehydrogenase-like flavoprotein